MLSEDTKVLKCNQYKKDDKEPSIIYADIECLMNVKINLKIHSQQK